MDKYQREQYIYDMQNRFNNYYYEMQNCFSPEQCSFFSGFFNDVFWMFKLLNEDKEDKKQE